ncbi:MAG: sigma-70 region 4 domain-containing protein [Planctomycetia bacterium]|nr:sigma-70 region 4 domain-containing protein [Planctomycetia bacterium]
MSKTKQKPTRASFKIQFQNLADDFKALAAGKPSDSMEIVHGTLAEARAGQSIIEAFRAGMLNLPGLREIVAWHTAADIPQQQIGVIVEWQRGPVGLFTDIVNGPNPAEFKGERAPTPAPLFGLLASLGYLPELTPIGAMRAARACVILASLVGSKPGTGKKRVAGKEPKELSNAQKAVVDLRDTKHLSFEEIGRKLGKRKSTVKGLYDRGKKRDAEREAFEGTGKSVKAQSLPLGDAAPRGQGAKRSGSTVREHY